MSSTNRRTWQNFHVGHLLLTVQLDSTTAGQNLTRHQELAGLAKRLVWLAETHRIPVTWAVSDPAHSAASSLITQSALEHELAILGDSNWVGPTAGRTRFARELVRRLAQARTTGLEITSLVPHVASIEGHVDLVVKQNISAVAGCELTEQVRPSTAPRALHYGVWELPITEQLPAKTTSFFGGKRATWKQIRRVARDAGTFHLLIDVPRVVESGRSAENSIAWLVKRIAVLRDRGLVRIETLRSMSARLSDVPAGRPQRSILHAAAA